MPYDPHRHRRRSIRLAGHDYTQPGAYFVTINTHAREPLLARIDAAGHAHTPLGAAVARNWAALPRHFPNIALDAWVLMPDHLHGIVVIHSWLPARAAEGPAGDRRPRGTAPGSLPAITRASSPPRPAPPTRSAARPARRSGSAATTSGSSVMSARSA